MPTDLRTALTIAGSDSSGGAGIQADLKTFAALGVFGVSAITAVTAQNTVGVVATYPLPADFVATQIEAVAGDLDIHATKTGMLPSAAVVEAVAAAIDELELPLVVVDPVMKAKNGESLADEDAVGALRAELIRRAFVITPNIPEAEVLIREKIESAGDVRRAAEKIHRLGAQAVVIKGGHAAGDVVTDVLFNGRDFFEFHVTRLHSRSTHGTGCTHASAIAAYLALGRPLSDATELAQRYVAGAILHSVPVGHGYGPLAHFWNFTARTSE